MSEKLNKAIESKAWPFVEAERILKKINYTTPKKGYVLFETGYGPSGLPHIGTFGEVARTTMVRNAFHKISDIPTRLFCFSDDMDGLRKVPSNVPNPEMVAEHMHKPLTDIPDPFGEAESYGHYMNAKLRSFLDKFGFEYEFFSATECYKNGMFDTMIMKALDRYDQIMDLMLPTFREERKATYSPFLPICPKTGRVLQIPIEEIDKIKGTVTYRDDDGSLVTVPATGGHCKLQWKPDFGMRWAGLEVDYEMYGKDHMPNAEIYSEICRILDGVPPIQFFYELFLNEAGEKISKSKGNSITVDEWLEYAPIESMALFMYQSPSKAKRLYFDVIPKNVDDYLTFNKKYHEETDEVKKMANPAYHIHNGDVPNINMFGLTFSLLLNLASVCNPSDKSVLWGFITKYAPNAEASNAPYLDHLTNFAVKYYNDFIKPHKNYLKPTAEHKILLKKIYDMLNELEANSDSTTIQNAIYSIGMESGYENLKDFFQILYKLLLGQEEGPRLGSFIQLYGIEETKTILMNLVKN
jgi:lysyl-tRNA synthetase class 1